MSKPIRVILLYRSSRAYSFLFSLYLWVYHYRLSLLSAVLCGLLLSTYQRLIIIDLIAHSIFSCIKIFAYFFLTILQVLHRHTHRLHIHVHFIDFFQFFIISFDFYILFNQFIYFRLELFQSNLLWLNDLLEVILVF